MLIRELSLAAGLAMFVAAMGPAAEPSLAGYAADMKQLAAQREPWPERVAVPRLDAVTKDHYRKTAEVFFEGVQKNMAYWLRQPKPYPNMSVYSDAASWFAMRYALTGDEQHARNCVKCLEHAHRLIAEPQEDKRNTQPSWLHVVELCQVQRRLGRSPAYTAEHRRWVREIALRAMPSFPADVVEYGAFNRAFHAALAAEALLLLVPDAPDAGKWRTYKETVWDYWWQFRDNDESTDHYNALWFRYLLEWVELRGAEHEFWSDPGVRRLFERYLYQVFPMGAFPHYSDSCGWNVSWGHWVWLFEACAAHWKDGRYKWAAHRLYDYGVNRIENLGSWSYTGSEAGWSLLRASAVADDAVPEKPREHDVAVLLRTKAVQRSEPERIASRQFLDLVREPVPDKLAFYGGSGRDALSMLVDVVGDAGHSHGRRPAVLALADHQSVLLMSLGYLERRPEDHDIPLLSDYEGYPYDNTPYHIKSENNLVREATAVDLGPAGWGLVRVDNYQGYPATLVRQILFVKQAGVLIKDTVTLRVDLRMRWSPVYRVRNVGPDSGPNWVNTCLGPWVPLRGLGRDAPVFTRWRNNPRDLLVYFAPQKQGKLELVDEQPADATLPLPVRVQFTLRQDLRTGAPASTVALLVPHAPGPAADLAGGVRVLLDDADRTVVEFPDTEGVRNLVALNTSGRPVQAEGFATDSPAACIRHRDGKALAAGMCSGTMLRWAGEELARQAPAAQVHSIRAP